MGFPQIALKPRTDLHETLRNFTLVKLGLYSWITLAAAVMFRHQPIRNAALFNFALNLVSVFIMFYIIHKDNEWNFHLGNLKLEDTERNALERDDVVEVFGIVGHGLVTYLHFHHFCQSRCYYWVNNSKSRMLRVSVISAIYFIPFITFLSLQLQLTDWSGITPASARMLRNQKHSCEGFHSHQLQTNCPDVKYHIAAVLVLSLPVLLVHSVLSIMFIKQLFCCPKKPPTLLDFPRPPMSSKSLSLMKALDVELNSLEWRLIYGPGGQGVDTPNMSVQSLPIPGSSKINLLGTKRKKDLEEDLGGQRSPEH